MTGEPQKFSGGVVFDDDVPATGEFQVWLKKAMDLAVRWKTAGYADCLSEWREFKAHLILAANLFDAPAQTAREVADSDAVFRDYQLRALRAEGEIDFLRSLVKDLLGRMPT